MARRNFGFALAVLIALSWAQAALLSSCSSRLGWGVVLWTAPEGPLPAGSVVPVYIKSNIEQTYVVGVPGSQARGKKIELPLWQVKLFGGRGKARSFVKSMGENVSLYMVAARDGLPLRDGPSNNAKRVYRLREGQSVKILQKVEGDDVSTGGQNLQGSWYSVLTDDGTSGYAFSYAFRIYDEAKEGPPDLASSAKKPLSGRGDIIFSHSWRPEFFQEMVEDNRVDLDYFSLRYGLFVDAIRRQIRLELPAASKIFNYTGVSESKGFYIFEGSALKIKIESDSRIVCDWTGSALPADSGPDASTAAAVDAAAPADSGSAEVSQPAADLPDDDDSSPAAVGDGLRAGENGSAAFVSLASDPQEAIRKETLRRQRLLAAFVDAGGEWGSASSEAGGGRLSVIKNGRFTWRSRGDAAAELLPGISSQGGEVAVRLFLDSSLASSWEGVLSLRFDPNPDEKGPGSSSRKWQDFLYRHTPAGLVLSRAAAPVDMTVQSQIAGAASIVLEAAAR